MGVLRKVFGVSGLFQSSFKDFQGFQEGFGLVSRGFKKKIIKKKFKKILKILRILKNLRIFGSFYVLSERFQRP